MRKFLIVLLLVVAVVSASDAHRRVYPRCRNRNEVYKTCGTACEPSCSRPNPEVCTMQCVQGCQCRNGYLRDADGSCVEPCKCSKRKRQN